MRILVLSTWFPYPPDNGAKIRAHYLVQALGAQHQVTLVAFRPQGAKDAEWPHELEVVDVAVDPFRYVNLPQWLKYASPIPLAFWPSRKMQHAVESAARAATWDAVVAIQTPMAQYATQIHGPARVLDVDTSFSYQMYRRYGRITGPRAWVSWKKTHYYETRAFRQFQTCAVVSSEEIDFVQSMVNGSGCRVAKLTNGVDCEAQRPGQYPSYSDTLVYNGALTYAANYDAVHYFLAEIYPRLKQQVPDVSFTITGTMEGVDRSGLRLDDSVHFSGYVEDIRPVVGGSAVCVVPIRQGSGTRLKILEAMALGVPVVSTSKGAEGLDVVDGEHLLVADDPIEFVAKTQLALHDQALRARLINQARRRVEQSYDWRTIGQQFAQLVESAVDKQGRSS